MIASKQGRWCLLALLLASFLLGGCGTVLDMTHAKRMRVYGGTRYDFNTLADLWWDMPLSFATDTALLPFSIPLSLAFTGKATVVRYESPEGATWGFGFLRGSDTVPFKREYSFHKEDKGLTEVAEIRLADKRSVWAKITITNDQSTFSEMAEYVVGHITPEDIEKVFANEVRYFYVSNPAGQKVVEIWIGHKKPD